MLAVGRGVVIMVSGCCAVQLGFSFDVWRWCISISSWFVDHSVGLTYGRSCVEVANEFKHTFHPAMTHSVRSCYRKNHDETHFAASKYQCLMGKKFLQLVLRNV